MIIQDTAAYRRAEIRTACAARLAAALVGAFPDLQVVAARADFEDVADFVSVYFDDTERARKGRQVETEAELIVRVSTSEPADLADARLDEIASHVEADLSGAKLTDYVFDCFLAGTGNAIAPNGVYSALELRYELKYND